MLSMTVRVLQSDIAVKMVCIQADRRASERDFLANELSEYAFENVYMYV